MRFNFIKFYSVVLLAVFSLMSVDVFAQSKTVNGNIIDEESDSPIPGVSVIIKGTSIGTETDFDGNYVIKVDNDNAVLVFSYLGYVTQEISLKGLKEINVVLKPSSEQLDEVVVVGYGTTKKSDLTGSVVVVGGSELSKQNVSNVAEALTGKMAGVQVTTSEGSPDAEIKIRVRGGGSLTQDSSPLIIVDGFPVNSMGDVSPSDIESITVLKDASSTAIYGSRGANGVIIITTKSGKDGNISVSLNTFYGYKNIANTLEVQSPEDFVKWQYEYALLRDNLSSYEQYFGLWQDYDQYLGMKGNDWQKQVFGRTGETLSYDLGVRGGSEKFNFNFNYARYSEKAIMVGSDFKRDNLSFALKNKANDKVDLSFTIRYSNTDINGGGTNEQNEISSADARLRHSVGYSPIPIPGLTTDDTDEALSTYLVNPFVSIDDNQREQLRKNFNLLGGFSWSILDDLKLKVDVGMDNYNYLDYRFYGRSTYYANNRPAAENQGLPSLVFSDEKRVRYRNANTVNYDLKKILGEDHGLKILLGEEIIITKDNEVISEIQGFPKFFTFDDARNLTTQGVPQTVDNYYSPDDKLLSFFGRLNYDFKNKYLLTATFRADGSSKFLGDNRWGYFPSAAVAWKLSEENFLKDVSWVRALKIRLSYGEAGNNNIPSGQTVQSFQSYSTTFLNGIDNFWAASSILANPDLKWETTVTQNVGLDFDLFSGKLTGSVEAYKNVTKDLLINFPVPGTGYVSQYRNMGETQNTGVETSLNFNAIDKDNYGLNFNFNIGFNKNRINSLGSMQDFGQATNWASTQIGDDFVVRVGEPIGLMYGYQNDGRYEVSDFDYNSSNGTYTLKEGIADATAVVGTVMPGTMKLKDINGDGLVTVADNAVIGNANPLHTGGFVINANAYGFDLSAGFNWSYGNDVYNANKIEFNTSNTNAQFRNLTTDMADGIRWTNLDAATGLLVTDPDQLASMNANTTMWSPYMSRFVFSDWAVEDGSFLRLNTLTLGYNAPESIISHLKLSKLRFFVTANNVFIITNYSGLDPEVSTRRKTPLTPGVDYSPYPKSRSFVFGLNLNF